MFLLLLYEMKYSLNELAVIWLDSFECLDFNKHKAKILMLFNKPEDIFKQLEDYKKEIVSITSEEVYTILKQNSNNDYIKKILNELQDQSITTIYSENYPEKLKVIEDAPIILYYKGNLDLINLSSIAIVGTRTPTNYGKIITKQFSQELCLNGLVIVSGLAYGVDTISHEVCLENKGKTIAVLAGGLKNIYPASNKALADKIGEQGLLITEYRPGLKCTQFSFPLRNRIIAALSDGVLITEAKLKSGSLHTKEYALLYGKEIFAVPGNINSEQSLGTNRLIQSCQSMAVTCAEDILSALHINKITNSKPKVEYTEDEKTILNILGNEEVHYDIILHKFKKDVKTLNTLLTKMEFNEIIKKLAGNYYCKI